MKIISNSFTLNLSIFIFLITTFFNINIYAAQNCPEFSDRNADPRDIIKCGSPTDIVITDQGRSLFDIMMLINNVLAILAVFLSITGVIVGAINLAQAQSDKKAYAEAKGIITNSFLAFFITAALWIIISLVLNSLGGGGLIPIIKN